MNTQIDHNGRLAGWTERQIFYFWQIARNNTSRYPTRKTTVHGRVLKVLLARRMVFELYGRLHLTEAGEAVAKSCGWKR